MENDQAMRFHVALAEMIHEVIASMLHNFPHSIIHCPHSITHCPHSIIGFVLNVIIIIKVPDMLPRLYYALPIR